MELAISNSPSPWPQARSSVSITTGLEDLISEVSFKEPKEAARGQRQIHPEMGIGTNSEPPEMGSPWAADQRRQRPQGFRFETQASRQLQDAQKEAEEEASFRRIVGQINSLEFSLAILRKELALLRQDRKLDRGMLAVEQELSNHLINHL